MKKFSRLAILFMILALLLAACGGSGITEEDLTAAEARADTAEAALSAAEARADAAESALADAEGTLADAQSALADAQAAAAAAETAAPAEAPAEEPTPEPTPEPISNCEIGYEGETITIYQQAGLTGALASILGPGFINGNNDAVAQINAAGGICGATIEVRLEDTQYVPEQELAVYETYRAEDPKPMFILTYASGASLILKDRVVEDEIVNIAAGLSAEAFYNPADGWTVGVAPIYSDQFAGFLQWASENWADIKPEGAGDDIVVGVIGWANSFGAGATTPEALAYAESLGVTVLPLEEQEISPTADVTGQLQNLLVNGANVLWIQSLSFGPAQVIGTVRAMGAWDSMVVGSVNWGMNQDVINILGENSALAEGYYGVFPSLWWNDTDDPNVQDMIASFEAGGYPESDKGVGYMLSYGSVYAVSQIIEHAINRDGFENLSGATFFDAMKDLGTVSAFGFYELDVRDGNRAPREAQIRQAQMVDGAIQFMMVEDFFELPDTRPSP